MTISLFGREENTVKKGENAGNQHFLLFSKNFLKHSSVGSLKVVDHVVKSKINTSNGRGFYFNQIAC